MRNGGQKTAVRIRVKHLNFDDIPDICKRTAVVVTPMRQEYVYHELESRVSVFSHVKENFTVTCGDVTLQHCLGKGLDSEQCAVASRV